MKNLILLLQFLLLSITVYPQAESSSSLHQIIKEKDSLLFNLGFNHCDSNQFESLISENFEFYHDQHGITNSKRAFIDNIKDGLCKLPYKPKRVLLDSSLKIYPLKNNKILYGAVETGIHFFYSIENDSTQYLTSTAKFSHLWLLENGKWKLGRGLSYDHEDFQKPTNVNPDVLFKNEIETEKWLKEKGIPAIGIGFIDQGKIVQTSVFGELEKDVKAPKNTIWNVASLTKPITALIALKLIDSGKLGLDEALYKYYIDADISNDPRVKLLTPRIILSHQTGFINNRETYSDSLLKFEFEPGTKYQYSGEGYDFLRKAIEHKFNTTIEELAFELIFEPLDMKNTSYVWQKKYAGRTAKWHTKNGETYPLKKQSKAHAADDLLTTLEDYMKFVSCIINGGGLSKELYLEMIKNQVRIKDSQYFGLGWWIDENINADNDFAILHGGDDIGVHTIVFILPKTKQGLVIFTNSDTGTEAYPQILINYLGENGKGIMRVEMK